MNVCVFGLPRSGTTAIYALLQYIFRINGKLNCLKFYEPLLWQKDIHAEWRDYRYLDSISWDGLCNHLKLPLFIEKPEPFVNNEYLKELFICGSDENDKIIKFVRVNGRFRLLKRICPDCKFIFIIRNPAEVLNSIRNRFSFYGGEFHKDDQQRFADNVNEIYQAGLMARKGLPSIQKEYEFWYYMNRFALESFQDLPDPPLTIIHESINSGREHIIRSICDHLGFVYKPIFLEYFSRSFGPKTEERKCTGLEFKKFKKYLIDYNNLLNNFGLNSTSDYNLILQKFKISDDLPPVNKYYGMNALFISSKYQSLENKIGKTGKDKNSITSNDK